MASPGGPRTRSAIGSPCVTHSRRSLPPSWRLPSAATAWWLSWITVALALVAASYALVGPAGFQKRDGRLSPAATVLLAPYLAGACANRWAWTRRHPAPDPVVDDVWIGRLPTRRDLGRGGFDAVVDLTCELPVDPGTRAYAQSRGTRPHAARCRDAHRRRAGDRAVPAPTGRVLVCCALGYSRSATVVAAWLVATGRAPDADAAVARLRDARPQIVMTDAHLALIASATRHAAT